MRPAESNVIPLRDAQRHDPEHQEERLRELCAWYEWAEPPNIAAASVLQDAADAVQEGALSAEAAEALLAVWQPFVRHEAEVGNLPPIVQPENVELGVLQVAVNDLGRRLKDATTPEERRRLTKLLNEQIANYERTEKARSRGSR